MLNSKKGFTVFEMLVVLAIIAIIAGLILTRYRSGEQVYALEDSVQRFVSDLRQAQGMALAGAETGTNNVRGYGFYVADPSTYYIFLNTDAKTVYDSSTSVVVKTIKVPNGVAIDSNSFIKSIFFIPPIPRTIINGNDNTETINFVLSKGSSYRIVKVTKYGKIEVQ